MKITQWTLLCVLLFSIVSAFANPPSALSANFDQEKSLLTFTFTHESKDPNAHFISDVSIRLNKTEIIHQTLSKQDKANGGSLIYKIIDVQPGDKIEMTLKCNKFGKQTFFLDIK